MSLSGDGSEGAEGWQWVWARAEWRWVTGRSELNPRCEAIGQEVRWVKLSRKGGRSKSEGESIQTNVQ